MQYRIKGRVIDSVTGDRIGGVRLEVWHKGFDHPGSATTISVDSFSAGFDESAFRDIFFDNLPDAYFNSRGELTHGNTAL